MTKKDKPEMTLGGSISQGDLAPKVYIAKMQVGVGGSWAKGATEDEAIARCIEIAKRDWKNMYRIEGEVTLSIYEDGGTDSFDDDTFLHIATATA